MLASLTAIIVTGVFSITIVLLLAAAATKVFTDTFFPREDRWWEEDDECIADDSLQYPLQHPSEYTDHR